MNRRLRPLFNRIRALPHHGRTLIGIALLLGGILWFLPVLGLWMIPLGLLVLSTNFAWARRGYLSMMVWWRKYRARRKAEKNRS
jgi:hypothetical protein